MPKTTKLAFGFEILAPKFFYNVDEIDTFIPFEATEMTKPEKNESNSE